MPFKDEIEEIKVTMDKGCPKQIIQDPITDVEVGFCILIVVYCLNYVKLIQLPTFKDDDQHNSNNSRNDKPNVSRRIFVCELSIVRVSRNSNHKAP